MKNKRSKILRSLRILLAIAILFAIITLIDTQKIWTLVKEVEIAYFCVALIAVILIRILMAIRWKAIVSEERIRISILESLYINLVSQSVGFISPGGIGADIVKGGSLYNKKKNLKSTTRLLLLDRIFGISGMLSVAIVGIVCAISVLGYRDIYQLKLSLIISIILLSGILIMPLAIGRIYTLTTNLTKMPSLPKKAISLANELFCGNYTKGILLKLFFISILMQVLRGAIFLFLFYSIAVQLEPAVVFALTPIVFIMMLIPVSVGGFGVREASTYFLFQSFGVTFEQCVAVGVLFYALQIVMIMPGIVLLIIGKKVNT